jgi:hypothetical protein
MSGLKKVALFAAAATISTMIYAGSDLDSRVRELDSRVKELEKHKRCDAKAMMMDKDGITTLTSTRPKIEGHGFALSFDVFYWQVKSGGTDYCVTSSNPTAFGPTNIQTDNYDITDPINGDDHCSQELPIKGKVKELSFNKWDWGFRVGAGYNFEHGDWDIYANYTYFTDDSSDVTTAPQVYPIVASIFYLANSPANGSTGQYNYSQMRNFTKATSQFRFRFNRIDLELGRDFFVEKYLSLRPHIGLMTAWITQKQTSQYTGGDALDNTLTVHDHNSYWGIGPRLGVNTKWRSCNGFGIIGNISAGIPYGRFDLDYEQNFSYQPEMNYIDADGDMHRFTPTMQAQLGFGYDKTLSCSNNHLSLFLAWDIQYWWRVSQHINQDVGRIGEDMSLQGVTFHIKWDF